MIEKNKGHILNVASIAGFMPGPLIKNIIKKMELNLK